MNRPRSRVPEWLDPVVVLGACAAAAASMWDKLNSLIWLDPAWWLHETLRFARGEMPYRDFFWQYPPAGLAVVGYPLRWFGISFYVAQSVIDVLSLAIVALSFALLGYLVPRLLRILICVLLIAVGATTQTYFSLFSLLSYSPALHVAAIGLLTMLLGSAKYLREGKLSRAAALLLVAGCWIALLSKQEAMLAAPALLLLLTVFDPYLDRQGGLAQAYLGRWGAVIAASFLVPAVVYGALVKMAGLTNFSTALRGYGLATIPCPWWPTGLGIFAALAALGTAAAIAGAGSLLEARRWHTFLGARYFALLGTAMAGVAIWAAYEYYMNGALLTQAAPISTRILGFGKEVLSTSSVLRPVLWASLIYWASALWSAVRGHWRTQPELLQVLLLLTVPVTISIRGLFGSTLTPSPEVPALAYPFFLIVGPYLLIRALEFPGKGTGAMRVRGETMPMLAASTLVALYIAARVGGGYTDLLSGRDFTTLETASGKVRLRDDGVQAAIYRYVMERTAPDDPILELPYGGAMVFATHRQESVFGTIFTQVPTPEFIRELDLERITAKPPRVVVALDEPHFGTFWGIRGNMGCVAPRLTWVPDKPSWDPALVLPLTQFIEANYHVDRKIGEWVLLVRN